MLVEIPFTDGHEQHGTRPAIIVAGVTRGIIAALPLTTNDEALLFSHTVPIKRSTANGLSSFSIALIYQVRALDATRCKRKLGVLSKADYSIIHKGLKKYLDL